MPKQQRTRKIAMTCVCGDHLYVIVDEDDNPVLEDGDAQAICLNAKCSRAQDRRVRYIDRSQAKTHFQVEA